MELEQKKVKEAFEELKKISLSNSEKSRVRGALVDYMKENPVTGEFPVGDENTIVISHSDTGWQAFLTRTVVRVMIIALTLVTGTVVASEKALPGDPLYIVKTHVTEPVRGLMNTSEEAQASWSYELAERRLEEVIALSESLQLTQNQYLALIEDFKNHAEASRTIGEHTKSVSSNKEKKTSISVVTEQSHVVGVTSASEVQAKFKDWLSSQKEQLISQEDTSEEKQILLSAIEEELEELEDSEKSDQQKFAFSTKQMEALNTLGVDVVMFEELLDSGETCFEEALGEERVEKLSEKEEPNLFDVIKIQSCVNLLTTEEHESNDDVVILEEAQESTETTVNNESQE